MSFRPVSSSLWDPDGAAAPAKRALSPDLELNDGWRLTDLLLMNDVDAMERLFLPSGLALPQIHWRPDFDGLPANELRRLAALWSSRRQAHLPPSAHAFDLVDLADESDYLMALDVLSGGEDFHYRHYGERIAEVTGFNMTGKLLSAVPTRSALAAFFLASYRAVVLSKAPLLTIHRPPSYPIDWTRLILPLVDASGAVTRMLAGNIPNDRTPRFNS